MSWKSRSYSEYVESSHIERCLSIANTVVELKWDSLSNVEFSGRPIKFSRIIGVGVQKEIIAENNTGISELKQWLQHSNDLVLGYFSYDLKNSVEGLTSSNADPIGFSNFHFYIPQHIYLQTEEGWIGLSHGSSTIEDGTKWSESPIRLGQPLQAPSKHEYTHKVENLMQHIQFGDIYEVNFCVQHGYSDTVVKPYQLYKELQRNSPAPFSCFVKDAERFLLSASPERFMRKDGSRLISQPMKGTNRRTSDNEAQKNALKNDLKEVAENVMITDLVRNDLSRSAKKGSVKVDELCGVYEFEHVNQMISTVSAELREDVHPLDALLNAFPMGSMTGAPKIRAMELIDQFEDFSRGLYSGSVGYFTPDLDFDFNVIIRSILYNEEKQLVTFPTGSAITIQSDPKKEYEECMLKAEAMRNVLINHAK